MRTSSWFALLGAGLAACIGAALAHQDRTATAQDGSRRHTAGAEIDRKAILPLAAVRAPTDLGERALEHVKKLVELGPRNPGTPGWTRQLDYLQKCLEAQGLTVQRDTWTDRKELVTFTNLWTSIPGRKKERIVLCCHHDTKCTKGHPDPAHNFDFVGANDGGSGVALLIELAAELRRTPRDATIDLVFFDGEESLDWAWNDAARALFGSKRFAMKHREALLLGQEARIEALILLDMVGRKDLHIQEELYSTPRLRSILWSAAVACGHDAHVFRTAEAAADDHVPFLDVGIPCVDLIDLQGNPNWHTATDTVDNMSAASLQKTADIVLTMLPEVERAYVQRKD